MDCKTSGDTASKISDLVVRLINQECYGIFNVDTGKTFKAISPESSLTSPPIKVLKDTRMNIEKIKMSLLEVKGYEAKGIKIDLNGTEGELLELHGLLVVLPKKPKRSEILFYDRPKAMQMWQRLPMPEELQRIRSMDEWPEKPSEFRKKFRSYIEQEFQRRRRRMVLQQWGPTYITGRHYVFTVV